MHVDTNGTVRLKIKAVMDTVKIKPVKTLKPQKKKNLLNTHLRVHRDHVKELRSPLGLESLSRNGS